MRTIVKLLVLGALAYAARVLYDNWRASRPVGFDTPTGTDPAPKWSEPGYQDKSLGQAVAQDAELVDRLVAEEPSLAAAEQRFARESAGAPALARQEGRDTPGP
jgi:hypothetical protein